MTLQAGGETFEVLRIFQYPEIEPLNGEALEPWNFGTLELWNFGTLEPLNP